MARWQGGCQREFTIRRLIVCLIAFGRGSGGTYRKSEVKAARVARPEGFAKGRGICADVMPVLLQDTVGPSLRPSPPVPIARAVQVIFGGEGEGIECTEI